MIFYRMRQKNDTRNFKVKIYCEGNFVQNSPHPETLAAIFTNLGGVEAVEWLA
jgi:hypothetical protein